MGKPKVTLYFDVVSPFARMAFYVLNNTSAFDGCEISYVPIFLGGLFKLCGNTAPIAVKNKGKWLEDERLRWQKYFNVPMSKETPPNFPPNTIQAMRALCAIQASQPAKLQPAAQALYEAFWSRSEVISKPEVVADVLGRALGEEAAKRAMEEAQGPGKKILMENTDRAFASGAFGLPWFECENAKGEKEGFWGIDHLAQVVDFLGLERPKEFRAQL